MSGFCTSLNHPCLSAQLPLATFKPSQPFTAPQQTMFWSQHFFSVEEHVSSGRRSGWMGVTMDTCEAHSQSNELCHMVCTLQSPSGTGFSTRQVKPSMGSSPWVQYLKMKAQHFTTRSMKITIEERHEVVYTLNII